MDYERAKLKDDAYMDSVLDDMKRQDKAHQEWIDRSCENYKVVAKQFELINQLFDF